ncbi:IS630 family transposase [Streptosporangium canum]
MRYAQGGGLTAGQRAKREQVRLRAAELFAQDYSDAQVAKELRVSRMSANRWRRAWARGGDAALASKGPASLPMLDEARFARLEAALLRGPAAHGWNDQYWTLARIRKVIGRMFHLSYSLPGVWKLLRRHGWSCQVPARRAIERDEGAIVVWKTEVWPAVERPRRTWNAWVCFEDECGRTLRAPIARTWAPRGATPVAHVPGRRAGRISVAALTCYRPGERSRLLYRVHVYRRRKDEKASFTWADYRDLILMAHRKLGAPIVLIWDNLNRHTCAEIRQFIAESADWLRVVQLPAYAPDLNPAEGVWSLLNRGGLANLAVRGLDELVRVVKRGLKKIQYRPHLIDGCLAGTGLVLTSL